MGDNYDQGFTMQYRHGDVLLTPVAELPEGATATARQGDLILAEGEVTGHAHRIADRRVTLRNVGEQRYIEVWAEGAVLDHEEHGQIAVAPGIYQVLQQREYSDVGLRNVAD